MEVSSQIPFTDENGISKIDETSLERESDSSDDNIVRGRGIKQGRRNLTDSDSDVENGSSFSTKSLIQNNATKSRIKKNYDSDSDSPSHKQQSLTATSRVSRVEDKRKKLHDKFKKLVTSQSKTSVDSDIESPPQVSENESSGISDGEISCLTIKKKIMKKKSALSAICDADTSDDEVNSKVYIKKQRKEKAKPKSTIQIEPRMSAKQAMENMQKIKSESNRMLREKDVSLPYHKPRVLSLQDFINRKKPTLCADGRAMPIKMNSEQLAQYAEFLEERQKEMIELCKSETDEEADPESTMNVEDKNISEDVNNDEIQDINKTSDEHFDEIVQENNEATENNITIETSVFNETKNDSENIPDSDEIIQENNKANEENNVSKETDIINETKNNSEMLSVKTIQGNNEADEENNISKESDIIDDTKTGSNDKNKNPPINSETSCHNSNNLDSQLISLKFDLEKTENDDLNSTDNESHGNSLNKNAGIDAVEKETPNATTKEREVDNEFSDDENGFNLEDIDMLIENAEIIPDISNTDSSCTTNTITTTARAIIKPKLTGAPGMFIDLESGDQVSKVLTGVNLLKERYTYFSKLKSVEDLERNTKHKPGTQHFKLKHELEEQIAEQRSLEWEKRLEEETQVKSEMNMEPIDEIEKIESKLDKEEEENSSSEDDLVEDDVDMTDKPRKSNPMVDDEAEESDEEKHNIEEGIADDQELAGSAGNDDSDNSSSDDTSSESEDEKSKLKKGRILKAFEDSDDESNVVTQDKATTQIATESPINTSALTDVNNIQDEEIQLAQLNRSASEDIFATQSSLDVNQSSVTDYNKNTDDIPCTADLGSQTFSILDSTANKEEQLYFKDKLSATQSIDELKFHSFNKECSGSLSQNLLMSQSPNSQSQEIGDDIAALCTGKFYDNPFVTQSQENSINTTEEQELKIDSKESNNEISHALSMETVQKQVTEVNDKTNDNEEGKINPIEDGNILESNDEISHALSMETVQKQVTEVNDKTNDNEEGKIHPIEDGNILESILDELNEPEIETTNKFFVSNQDNLIKKRFIIDSDEENDDADNKDRKKKLKKRKPEKRALQISDDEEEDEALDEEEQESDIEEETDKMVEYDSEENEIEVKAKPSKKKRMGEFFENEAELTSEDEWVGSGDEDEAGLDRLEREEGDNDVFHQGQLQAELGQIHMREVLDQDKREVRLLQELLFEDGDLGDGHRQRKFRWKTDADGDDATGMGPINLTDTQEEEFESEELWRKQRHEREVFLRSMQESGDEEKPANTTVNRTAMIKANLNSSNATNASKKHESKDKTEAELQPHVEAKPAKDIPSPKKSFLILQQSYHGSLLSRGRGALARLAALATPLAADADAPRVKAASSGAAGNFVFATLSQPEPEPKVAKRKAETNVGTPKLLKKLKTEETQKYLKNSLFDHFKT